MPIYRDQVHARLAKQLIKSIIEETIKLQKQPKIGQIEELLKNRKEEFRYLVFKNYKIIYWINTPKMRIEITDVFDTRQNPVKLARDTV